MKQNGNLPPKKMAKAFFLDRDGVINKVILKNNKPFPPYNIKALKILPGVPEALEKIMRHNFLIIVITNQPDVSRGITSKSTVESINDFLISNLPINKIYTCYHDNQDKCDCRKPKPGSLIKASIEFSIKLKDSFMVGDRKSDIEAGNSVGCKTIFIDKGYNEPRPKLYDYSFKSLDQAINGVLKNAQD